MKKAAVILIVSLFCFSFTRMQLLKQTGDEIPYPEGYRNWLHIKSAVITKESPVFERFGGIHHIYANDKAEKGYRYGKFPDGSVLVFDILEAVETKGAITEGKRRIVDVMLKDSARFSSTGGWGFEEFTGNSKTERNKDVAEMKKCFSCHSSKKENDFIFSTYKE